MHLEGASRCPSLLTDRQVCWHVKEVERFSTDFQRTPPLQSSAAAMGVRTEMLALAEEAEAGAGAEAGARKVPSCMHLTISRNVLPY